MVAASVTADGVTANLEYHQTLGHKKESQNVQHCLFIEAASISNVV